MAGEREDNRRHCDYDPRPRACGQTSHTKCPVGKALTPVLKRISDRESHFSRAVRAVCGVREDCEGKGGVNFVTHIPSWCLAFYSSLRVPPYRRPK